MPGGRPSKIDQPVRQRPDGTTVTAGQEFIDRIRLGLPHDQAAASANLDRRTILNWRIKGSSALAKQLTGKRLTAAEQRYAEFVRNLERAEADAETSRLGVIERAASGGITITETHETHALDAQGVLVLRERRTVTKQLAPQWTAAAWWLERRLPQRYARRVELSGPEGGAIPIEDRARDLASALRDFQAGADAAREVSQNGVHGDEVTQQGDIPPS